MIKTGLVALLVAVKHICRTLNAYEAKAFEAIDTAASLDIITESQATFLKDFLTNALVACDLLKLITGY